VKAGTGSRSRSTAAKPKAPRTGRATTPAAKRAATRREATQVKQGVSKIRGSVQTSQVKEGVTKARTGATAIVRQQAERAVDLPVGAVLIVRERVEYAVGPWTTAQKRERELKNIRAQFNKDLNRFERRGGQARRKAVQRVRKTRTQLEREVRQQRRRVETEVKRNRERVEGSLKQAQSAVSETAKTLV